MFTGTCTFIQPKLDIDAILEIEENEELLFLVTLKNPRISKQKQININLKTLSGNKSLNSLSRSII